MTRDSRAGPFALAICSVIEPLTTAMIVSVVLAVALLSVTVSAVCPTLYSQYTDSTGTEGRNSCIRVYKPQRSVSAAEAQCVTDGGHLLTILSTATPGSNPLLDFVNTLAIGMTIQLSREGNVCIAML